MNIREEAIAVLVEKLRQFKSEAEALYASRARATKEIGSMDFQTYMDRRDAASLSYAVAYRCEQLIEEITGNLLFDELDAQDAAADQAARDAEAADDAWSTAEQHDADRDAEFAIDARTEDVTP
jgi:hypothetical protein